MKGKFTFLKTSLVGLFLAFCLNTAAQDISVPSDFDALNPETTDAIICNGDALTLQASLSDGTNNFVEWRWDIRNDFTDPDPDAGFSVIPDESTQDLVLSGLTPGYHVIRVFGRVGDCWSDDFDEIRIYVLPTLDVLVTSNVSDLNFCENDIPGAGSEVTLSADVTENPVVDENFSYSYQWWKINTVDDTRTDLGTGESYTLVAGDYSEGEWIYGVDVSYSVKTACGPYSSYDGTTGGITVIVTPAPSAPTITIVSTP